MAAKKRQKGLGKGLGALFNTDDVIESVLEGQGVLELKITEIEPNKNQPRRKFDEEKLEALAESIKEYGVLQPIVVKKLETGFYQIIAGERRWRASRMAGIKKIPAIVKEYDLKASKEIALIENLQREDLNPIEEAEGFAELMEEFNLTQEELSQKTGKSRPAIANSLRLLNLPKEIKQYLIEGKISSGHARAILAVEKKETQLLLAQKVISEEMSVRQIEAYINQIQKKPTVKKKSAKELELERYILSLEDNLSSAFGTKVKIHHGKNKGKIEIQYYSNDDFDRIMKMIKK